MTEKCYKITLDRLTSSDAFFDASAEELRVLLVIFSFGGRAVSRESVSALAGVSEARAASALSLWESAGIIAECASLTDEFETSPLGTGLAEEKSTAVAKSIRNSHLAEAIAEVLDSKKGFDIEVVYVADKTVLAEYFVICSGNTSTHIKSLVDETEYKIGQRDLMPYHVEGKDNNSWIVMDYSNVIVHVFTREAREFYNLEKLYEN